MNFLTSPSADVSLPPRSQKPHEQTDWLFTNSATAATAESPSHEVASCLPFDAEAALARMRGEHELLQRMAGLFAIQWNSLYVEIAKAAKQRDGTTLELTANKLKRSVASIGARATSRLAQELEVRGSKSDYHDIEKTCASLQIEIERLVNALKKFTKEKMLSRP
jgi:HPt (histidine-containing phosphotransfer) domain-containing protein